MTALKGTAAAQTPYAGATAYGYNPSYSAGLPAGAFVHPGLPAIAAVGAAYGMNTDRILVANVGKYDPATDQAFKKEIEEAVTLARTSDLPAGRLTLSELAIRITGYFWATRNEALDKLIYLLDTDPLTKTSAINLLKVAFNLMNVLQRDEIQKEIPEIQEKFARALYLVVENYMVLYAKGELSAITEDLKQSLLKIIKDIEKLNQNDHPRIKHTVEMSREAVKRLQGNVSKADKVAGSIVLAADALGALYRKDPGNFLRSMATLGQALANEVTRGWYESYLIARGTAQKALADKAECVQLLVLISKGSRGQNKDLTIGYAELLSYVATHTADPEIRRLALVGSKELGLQGLTSFLEFTKKGEERILYRTVELLDSFIRHSTDTQVVHDIKEALLVFSVRVKVDEVLKKDKALKERLSFVPSDQRDIATWLAIPASKPKPPSTPPPGHVKSAQTQFETKVTSTLGVAVLGPKAAPTSPKEDNKEKPPSPVRTHHVPLSGTVTYPSKVVEVLCTKCFPGSNLSPSAVAKLNLRDIQSSDGQLTFAGDGLRNFVNVLKSLSVTELNFAGIDLSGLSKEDINAIFSSLKDTKITKVAFGEITAEQADQLAQAFLAAKEAGAEVLLTFSLPEDYNEFAKALKRNNYIDFAIEYYTLGIEQYPDHLSTCKLLYNRGIAQETSDKWEEAEKDYLAALHINPKFILALNRIANIYSDKADKLERSNQKSGNLRSLCHKYVNEALSIDPNDPDALYTKACNLYYQWSYLPTRKDQEDNFNLLLEAIKLEERVVGLEPEDKAAKETYADMLQSQKNFLAL